MIDAKVRLENTSSSLRHCAHCFAFILLVGTWGFEAWFTYPSVYDIIRGDTVHNWGALAAFYIIPIFLAVKFFFLLPIVFVVTMSTRLKYGNWVDKGLLAATIVSIFSSLAALLTIMLSP